MKDDTNLGYQAASVFGLVVGTFCIVVVFFFGVLPSEIIRYALFMAAATTFIMSYRLWNNARRTSSRWIIIQVAFAVVTIFLGLVGAIIEIRSY